MSQIGYTGTPTIVYQMPKEAIIEAMKEVQASQVEDNFLAPLVSITISVKAAAEILGVHYTTVLRYVKGGMLSPEPRACTGVNSRIYFNLAKVLKFRRDKELSKLR